MSTSVKEIAWVAGILEGEGHFGFTNVGKRSPMITLQMTDLDVVERVRSLVDKSQSIKIGKDKRKETYKDIYRITLNGSRAIEWMMTIYPLMSVRRKSRIRECVETWRKNTANLMTQLRNLGYSDDQITLVRGFRAMGLNDEQVMDKLAEFADMFKK